jgi:hypothetical protein
MLDAGQNWERGEKKKKREKEGGGGIKKTRAKERSGKGTCHMYFDYHRQLSPAASPP